LDAWNGVTGPLPGSRAWLLAKVRRAVTTELPRDSLSIRPLQPTDNRQRLSLEIAGVGELVVGLDRVRVVRSDDPPRLRQVVDALVTALDLRRRPVPSQTPATSGWAKPNPDVVRIFADSEDVARQAHKALRRHVGPKLSIHRAALLGRADQVVRFAAMIRDGQLKRCYLISATPNTVVPEIQSGWQELMRASDRPGTCVIATVDAAGRLIPSHPSWAENPVPDRDRPPDPDPDPSENPGPGFEPQGP